MSEYSGEVGDEARALLHARGVSDEEIERAAGGGRLHLLVLEQLVLPGAPRYTEAEVADLSGIPLDQARRLWRALGFAAPTPDERIFTDQDLDALVTLNGLVAVGVTELDIAVQLTRVVGSSMARVADAQLRATPVGRDPSRSAQAAEFMALTGGGTAVLATLLEYVYRRHLHAAARRELLASSGGSGATEAVGFADLVGFTALSQQLNEADLAGVVSRFEEVAYDTVAAGGGRVVKMIGDEVMFVVADPETAAEIGLALADTYADDEHLSDVRVGLACGPVLARDGDFFGPVVNVASRIVNIAFPGTVVVSDGFHDAVEKVEGFEWHLIRSRHLKDIGRVRLWVLSRAGAPDRRERRRATARRSSPSRPD